MKNRTAFLVAGLAAAFLLSACGAKTPLTESQKAYAGTWLTANGSSLVIHENGSGNIELLGNRRNFTITGGSVTFEDDSLKISLLGITKIFKIDTAPTNVNGVTFMILDGTVFKKR